MYVCMHACMYVHFAALWIHIIFARFVRGMLSMTVLVLLVKHGMLLWCCLHKSPAEGAGRQNSPPGGQAWQYTIQSFGPCRALTIGHQGQWSCTVVVLTKSHVCRKNQADPRIFCWVFWAKIILGSLECDTQFSRSTAFLNGTGHGIVLYIIGKRRFWAFQICLCLFCNVNRDRDMSIWKSGFLGPVGPKPLDIGPCAHAWLLYQCMTLYP